KHISQNTVSNVMYIDMNSYFASCEQQRHPELRHRPVGVVTYDSPGAAVIAASIEAKRKGVKTGMRLYECKVLCPEIVPVTTHPAWYRQVHVEIMSILRSYCDDVTAKSIDEAVLNLATYRLIYQDLKVLARRIKEDIRAKYDYLSCSIGISANTFLAKLGTELQKPDGLIEITPGNIDGHLAHLRLTDLPGIAVRSERRLQMIGIKSPLELRHASPALLRKAFGGIVGDYWHRRLNFVEVDHIGGATQTMSTKRTVSKAQREDAQSLESLLIALCTRLEQRMVKSGVFCREASINIRYLDGSEWNDKVKFGAPIQDAMELRRYLIERMHTYCLARNLPTLLTTQLRSLGVVVCQFIGDKTLQYSLFDNRMKHDVLRKAMYNIKDKYGKNSVRKGGELLQPKVMRDAIGFGSVKDMSITDDGDIKNKYMLEEEDW
ncbi:MAG: DNA polymerase IV, partial [Chitinophagia bacterium]|nr:DNA polymerase IV [Chitinophagia bacterium]